MRHLTAVGLTAAAITLVAAQPAGAAALFIDDFSSEGNIIFTMNDFEGGFQINGSTVQSGLGSPATVTLAEDNGLGSPAEIDFSGVWVDLGETSAQNKTFAFTEPGAPAGSISDILHITYSSSGGFGHLDGFVMSDVSGLIDPSTLPVGIITADTIFLEETDTAFDFSAPFLTARFRSDAAADVPEPASLALLGVGLLGLGFVRRKRG